MANAQINYRPSNHLYDKTYAFRTLPELRPNVNNNNGDNCHFFVAYSIVRFGVNATRLTTYNAAATLCDARHLRQFGRLKGHNDNKCIEIGQLKCSPVIHDSTATACLYSIVGELARWNRWSAADFISFQAVDSLEQSYFRLDWILNTKQHRFWLLSRAHFSAVTRHSCIGFAAEIYWYDFWDEIDVTTATRHSGRSAPTRVILYTMCIQSQHAMLAEHGLETIFALRNEYELRLECSGITSEGARPVEHQLLVTSSTLSNACQWLLLYK